MGFFNPSVGNSSLQMNRSGKLFTQSYWKLESFSLYQCGYLWRQTPAGTTKHTQHLMHEYNCFKTMIASSCLPTSTRVSASLVVYKGFLGTGHWEGCFALHGKLFQEQDALMITASHLFISNCSGNESFSLSSDDTFPLAVNKQKFSRNPLRQKAALGIHLSVISYLVLNGWKTLHPLPE